MGTIPHLCRYCGRIFPAFPSERRVFCSRACSDAGRARQGAMLFEPVLCSQCGTAFTPTSRRAHRTYCSHGCYVASLRSTSPRTRFYTHVEIPLDDSACWLWIGPVAGNGYGQLQVNGQRTWAHRLSYELHRGPIPDGLMVRHVVCHTPLCVNWRHLDVGTAQDNMDDALRDGTREHLKGPTHPLARLTPDDVRAIRSGHERGDSYAILARRYGVSKPTIASIISGKTWGHV